MSHDTKELWCAPSPLCRGVEPPKRGMGKRGMNFFKGGGEGCNFYIKNKLRFEIFNDKKVYKQKYFSLS